MRSWNPWGRMEERRSGSCPWLLVSGGPPATATEQLEQRSISGYHPSLHPGEQNVDPGHCQPAWLACQVQLPWKHCLTWVSNLSQAHLFGQIQYAPGLPALSGGSNGCQEVKPNFSHFGMHWSDYQVYSKTLKDGSIKSIYPVQVRKKTEFRGILENRMYEGAHLAGKLVTGSGKIEHMGP